MAMSSDPLTDFLVHQVLSAGLAWALQNDLFRVIVAGNNRSHLQVSPLQGFPLLFIGLALRLGTLWRVAVTLLAADMSATGALVAAAECCLTSVAYTVDAHASSFLDTHDVSLSRMPFTWLDL
jgi:hypothetical protein